MATAYETVLASVTAETGVTQKVPVLVAGIKAAIKVQYAGRADQDMHPIAVKELDGALDEIANSYTAMLAALVA